VRDVLLHFVRLDQQTHGEHALAEVVLVKLPLEHELVEMLQRREREPFILPKPDMSPFVRLPRRVARLFLTAVR
jgi:hypothetical protein